MTKAKAATLSQLQALCKRNAYIYSTSDFNNFHRNGFVLGPLGTELKRNFLSEWWSSVVSEQEHVEGITFPQQRKPLFTTNNNLAVDDEISSEQRESDSKKTSLLLRNSLDEDLLHYYQHVAKKTLPLGLAQIGQCHQTDVGNKQFLFNSSEFTQVCLLFFCASKDAIRWQDWWQRERLKWWRKFARQPSNFTSSEVQSDGSTQSIDILYPFPWGHDVIETITNYGSQLTDSYQETQKRKTKSSNKVHTIKISGSVERGMLAYLFDVYHQRPITGRSSLVTVMKFHNALSPYKLAVLPETLEREVLEISGYLAHNFRIQQGWNVLHCNKHHGNLAVETLRLDEMGVPYTIMVGEKALDTGEVKIRDRDTEIMRTEHITRVMKIMQGDIR